VHLITEDERRIPATVCDVSPGGMRVKTFEQVASGLPVRIEVNGFDARGLVSHCARKGDLYVVGVALVPP
jgi:hypothetical protein